MSLVRTKIKVGDNVIVIAGNDKRRQGVVQKIFRQQGGRTRVLVEGVHKVKKHERANPQKGKRGGVIEQEAWIDISNVQIYDATAKKGSKIGYRILKDGSKVRYYKASGEVLKETE